METKYEVISLFPTPLYINEVPKQLVEDHIPFLDQEEMIDLDNTISGSRSKNSYLFYKNEYENLSKYILQHATHYIEEFLRYNYINYKFSQSWISIKNPNDKHIKHTHPHSLISGVLFYGESQNTSSTISFYRDDTFGKVSNFHKRYPIEDLNNFSYTSYNINFIPNLLILFPSFLEHSVPKNITNTPRKSLAFNIVPKDGFGSEKELSELKFNN